MPEVTRTWRINGTIKPLNPAVLAAQSEEQDQVAEWHGFPNGITIPRGRQHGVAHFLLGADDVETLRDAANIEILCYHEDGTTFWHGWTLQVAEAITKQSKPAHWVRFADPRFLFENSTAEGERYNLRNSETDFVTATKNAGTAYTWQEVLADLWAKLPGAYAVPTLPTPPASTPENLYFDGMGAWRAINQVLSAIGCTVVYDPFTATFEFIDLNVAQSITYPTDTLLFEGSAIGSGFALPQKAGVLYHWLPAGTNDYSPFRKKPHYLEGTVGGTQGTYEIVDTTFYWTGRSMTGRTGEVATAIKNLMDPLVEPVQKTFSGVFEELPGSRISAIRWVSDGTRGFETLVFYGFEPFEWPQLPDYEAQAGGSSIQYTIVSLTTATGGPYTGLKVATVTILTAPCGRSDLIGDSVEVVDHLGCVFDLVEASLIGVKGLADEQVAASLEAGAAPGTMSPCHWAATDRCCVGGA